MLSCRFFFILVDVHDDEEEEEDASPWSSNTAQPAQPMDLQRCHTHRCAGNTSWQQLPDLTSQDQTPPPPFHYPPYTLAGITVASLALVYIERKIVEAKEGPSKPAPRPEPKALPKSSGVPNPTAYAANLFKKASKYARK